MQAPRQRPDSGRRRIPALLAVAALLFTGCTDGGGATQDTQPPPSTTTTTAGLEATTTTTETPTPADRDLIARFLEFANHPDQERAKKLPFAAQVKLGLGRDFHVTRSPADLARAASWSIDVEHFRAYVGPFSALEAARDEPETIVSVGGHDRCASPPEPGPVGTEHLRRVSVQPDPSSYDSCLKWWSVDFFVNAGGQIEAVTLDAYEP